MDEDINKTLDRIVTDEAKQLSERFFIDPLELMEVLDGHLTFLYYRHPEGYRQLFDRLVDQVGDAFKSAEPEEVLQYYQKTPTDKLVLNPFQIHHEPQTLRLEDQLANTSVKQSPVALEPALLFRPGEFQEQRKLIISVPKESLTVGSHLPFQLPGYLFYAVVVIAQHGGKVMTEAEFGEKYLAKMQNLKQTHKKSDDSVKNLSRYASEINNRVVAQGIPIKWKLLLNRRSVGYQLNPIYKVEIQS